MTQRGAGLKGDREHRGDDLRARCPQQLAGMEPRTPGSTLGSRSQPPSNGPCPSEPSIAPAGS